METLKTALVVVLLLAVLYGVYVVLNQPDFQPPDPMSWKSGEASPLDIRFGTPDHPAGSEAGADMATDQYSATNSPSQPAGPSSPAALVGLIESPDDRESYSSGESGQRPNPPPDLAPRVEPERPPATYDVPPALASISPELPARSPRDTTPIPDINRPAGTRSADITTADAFPTPERSVPAAAADPSPPPTSLSAHSIYESERNAPTDPYPAPLTDNPRERSENVHPTSGFGAAWQTAQQLLREQRWAEALSLLSGYYDSSEVTSEQRQKLLDLLDPLAGKVVYSTEHLLEPPYRVQPGETLDQIAERYQVPAALLQNINGLADPRALAPGTELKVLQGPFRAEIRLDRGELVLFVDEYYAGRFSISPGNDPAPRPAKYFVVDKQPGQEYFAPDGTRVELGAADNPYGRYWLDLGQGMCLHGTAEVIPAHGGLGCLSLNTADAADIYGILSVGSPVLIR